MISVTVICKNEEKNIRRCLESAKWADDIIIIDSGSTDKTLEIAKEYTENIEVIEWNGYSHARKIALQKVKTEWVLPLDADEEITNGLKDEIIDVIKSGNQEINGYKIPRKSFFLNKWIKHCGWYPGYQMRLCRTKFTSVAERLVHEGYIIEGKTGYLKNDINHYTVNSIYEFTAKINEYSTLQAIEKVRRKKVGFKEIYFNNIIAFYKHFIFKRGFLDGVHGLMVSMFDLITNVLTYMKIYELQNKDKV